MKNPIIIKLLPHAAFIAAFFLITLIYMHPLLEGKNIKQLDDVNAAGMSQELNEWQKKTGEHALWTNSMFGGMPGYLIKGTPSFNVYSELAILLRFGTPYKSYAIVIAYFIGFYLMMLAFGFNPLHSFLGALAFGFSSYNFIIIEAGHVSKAYAIAFMAPVVGTFYMAYRGQLIWGGILTTFALGLQISAMHPQITYYLMLMLACMVVAEGIVAFMKKQMKAFVKASVVIGIAGIFAFLPNVTNMLATYEYGAYSIRGPSELTETENEKQGGGLDRTYALAWSYGRAETFTMLIPGLFGGSSMENLGTKSEVYKELQANRVPNAKNIVEALPAYWGDMPFTSGPVYVGAIICFLFVLGLILVKGALRWWILVATVLSIMLAWGRHFPAFTDLFFYYFPFYDKFRAVSMTLVIAGLTMPILAMFALREVLNEKIDKKKILKAVYIAAGITGGLALLFALAASSLFSFQGNSDAQLPEWLINPLIADRKSLASSDSFRSFVYILLAAAAIYIYINGKIKKTVLLSSLVVLVLTDMWAVNYRYLNASNFVPARKTLDVQPTQANLQILSDKDPNFRVLNTTVNPFTDAHTSYFHKSVGGYHGAKLRRYQDVIDRHMLRNNTRVFDMLNTKYYIVRNEQGQVFAQYNPGALGNAWFVKNYIVAENADMAIALLDTINPANTAIVEKQHESHLTGFTFKEDSLAVIKFVEYQPDYLKYSFSSKAPQLTVFSEIYYNKGWKAFINGKEQAHFRLNYLLRGMLLEAGQYEIEFRFEPSSVKTGKNIAAASSILVILLLLGGLLYEIKRYKQ